MSRGPRIKISNSSYLLLVGICCCAITAPIAGLLLDLPAHASIATGVLLGISSALIASLGFD
jgi:hypothetical protein